MLALRLNSVGGAPVLEDVPVPPEDVVGQRGRVLAAAINPSDILRSRITTSGETSVIGDTSIPRTVGTEAVLETDVGRRVYVERAVVPYGTLAEHAIADPAAVFELPEDVSDVQAVACGIAGLAAWVPMATLAQLQGDETVLVLGATGASGQIALCAARVLGAGRIVAAGRRPEALSRLVSDGFADVAVRLSGDQEKDALALREATGGRGYDVVADFLFGDAFATALSVTAPHARVIPIGMSAGTQSTVNGMDLLLRGVRVLPYSNVLTPKSVRAACYRDMMRHIAAGRVRTDVDVYPLTEAETAWRRQAEGAPGAKLVVRPMK
jgi:NADPH2:quinone reductase